MFKPADQPIALWKARRRRVARRSPGCGGLGACGVSEVGSGSLTSGDRWSDMIPPCRCGCSILGRTRPKLRPPEAADRWTWLVIAAHTQLRLGRPHIADLHRPWER